MPASKAHMKATDKYNAKAYDRIAIRVRRDADITKDVIQAAADAEGKSLNAYIMDAIRDKIKRPN